MTSEVTKNRASLAADPVLLKLKNYDTSPNMAASSVVLIDFLVIILIIFDSEDVVMRASLDNVRDTAATAGYLILRIIPE